MENSKNSEQEKQYRRWRINVFAATWLSYVGYYFCRKGFGIVKPTLKQEHGFLDNELSYIWTAYLASYMIGQFLSASIGRRYTCRILLSVGMCLTLFINICLGIYIGFFEHPFWEMFILMIFNGFAQATGWPGNVGLLAKWTHHKERGRLMALWGTCYQIGSLSAKHCAAFMLAYLGISWSFWSASIVMFIILLFFSFFGKEQPENIGFSPFITEINTVDSYTEKRNSHSSKEQFNVFRIVFAMGTIYFCFKFFRYAVDSWAPLLIRESFPNLSASASGHLSVIYDWIGFLGVLFSGFLSDYFFKSQRTPVIFWMTLGMFFSILSLWYVGANSLFLFIFLLGISGFMSMGPDSLLSGTAAMDVSSKKMAVVASGIINGLGSAGPIVQELAIGSIKSHYVNQPEKAMEPVFTLLLIVGFFAVIGTGLLWLKTSHKGVAL